MPRRSLTLVCKLFILTCCLTATSANAQIRIPYPLDSFQRNETIVAREQVEATLQQLGIQKHKIELRSGRAYIDASAAQHKALYQHLNPNGKWVTGYFYYKLSRTNDAGITHQVRYYREIPAHPSGYRLSELMDFHLEPIYNARDLQAIAPELPLHFNPTISLTPNIEGNRSVSLILDIQSQNFPQIETEVVVQNNVLTEISGFSISQGGDQIEGSWQCRLLTTERNPKRDALKKKIQPYLDKQNSNSDPEVVALKDFFKNSEVDFTSHPKSRLDYDGEQIIARLPSKEMRKLKGIMAQSSEIRQGTLTARLDYKANGQKNFIEIRNTCISGKRSMVSILNLAQPTGSTETAIPQPKIELSSTAYTESNDISSVIIDLSAKNTLSAAYMDCSADVSFRGKYDISLAEHSIQQGEQSQEWTLKASYEPHQWTQYKPNEIVTEFIPVSRATYAELERPDSHQPINPFAPPQIESMRADKQDPSNIDYLMHALGIQVAEEIRQQVESFNFDGAQFIITAPYQLVEAIQQKIQRLEYNPPIQGTLSIQHQNEADQVVSHQTALTGKSGKRSHFTLRQGEGSFHDYKSLSGVEMVMNPYLGENGSALADIDWTLKLPEKENYWWLKVQQEEHATEVEQYLPRKSAYKWRVSESSLFESKDL